tara:strand:+ start:88 stop:465 length:378 start_codon:yes stop_codon:yes gene_type:complete
MANSFNSTVLTINNGLQNLVVELTSLTFTGGEVPAIDVTTASDTRRKQTPGIRAPFQLQIEGHAPNRTAFEFPTGGAVSWTITGNGGVHMDSSGTDWYCESSEITGSIDESITFSATLVEGSAAS